MKVNCYGQNQYDGYQFNHKKESFMKINSITLIIPFGYKSSFETLNTTIKFPFHLIYLLIAHIMFTRWTLI